VCRCDGHRSYIEAMSDVQQSVHKFLASPSAGSLGHLGMRALVIGDLPAISCTDLSAPIGTACQYDIGPSGAKVRLENAADLWAGQSTPDSAVAEASTTFTPDIKHAEGYEGSGRRCRSVDFKVREQLWVISGCAGPSAVRQVKLNKRTPSPRTRASLPGDPLPSSQWQRVNLLS
jgi:hypothetical protein